MSLKRPFLNDRILTGEELDFVQYVTSDLDFFVKNATELQNVLIFPSVASHFRFLIHKVIEEDFGDVLTSFSVGVEPFRRLVICLQETIRAKVVSDMAAGFASDSIAGDLPSFKTLSASMNAKRTLDRSLRDALNDKEESFNGSGSGGGGGSAGRSGGGGDGEDSPSSTHARSGNFQHFHHNHDDRFSPDVSSSQDINSSFDGRNNNNSRNGSSFNFSGNGANHRGSNGVDVNTPPPTSRKIVGRLSPPTAASTPTSSSNGTDAAAGSFAAVNRKLRPDAQVYVPRAKRMEEERQKKTRHEEPFDDGARSQTPPESQPGRGGRNVPKTRNSEIASKSRPQVEIRNPDMAIQNPEIASKSRPQVEIRNADLASKTRPQAELYVPRFRRQDTNSRAANDDNWRRRNDEDYVDESVNDRTPHRRRRDDDDYDAGVSGDRKSSNRREGGGFEREEHRQTAFADISGRKSRSEAEENVRGAIVDNKANEERSQWRQPREQQPQPQPQRQQQEKQQHQREQQQRQNDCNSPNELKTSRRHKKKKKSSSKSTIRPEEGPVDDSQFVNQYDDHAYHLDAENYGGGGEEDEGGLGESERRESRRKRKEEKERRRAEREQRRREREERRKEEGRNGDDRFSPIDNNSSEVNGGERTIPYEFNDSAQAANLATNHLRSPFDQQSRLDNQSPIHHESPLHHHHLSADDPAILMEIPQKSREMALEEDSSVLLCGPTVESTTDVSAIAGTTASAMPSDACSVDLDDPDESTYHSAIDSFHSTSALDSFHDSHPPSAAPSTSATSGNISVTAKSRGFGTNLWKRQMVVGKDEEQNDNLESFRSGSFKSTKAIPDVGDYGRRRPTPSSAYDACVDKDVVDVMERIVADVSYNCRLSKAGKANGRLPNGSIFDSEKAHSVEDSSPSDMDGGGSDSGGGSADNGRGGSSDNSVTECGSHYRHQNQIAASEGARETGGEGDGDMSFVDKVVDDGDISENLDGDTWESLFTDRGDRLDESQMNELISAVGNVSVQKPQFDYTEYVPKEPKIVYETFAHVLEIFDFDPTTTTQDLQQVFASFQRAGFEIKWVDDTHAMGVFASAQAAADALAVENPVFKVRPLSEAIHQTKVRAKKFEEMLSQTYKERPQTSAITARRMVAGALGLRSNIPREQREREREQLRKAKELRRAKTSVAARTDAWEGEFAEEG